jgi:hypothetical protein
MYYRRYARATFLVLPVTAIHNNACLCPQPQLSLRFGASRGMPTYLTIVCYRTSCVRTFAKYVDMVCPLIWQVC